MDVSLGRCDPRGTARIHRRNRGRNGRANKHHTVTALVRHSTPVASVVTKRISFLSSSFSSPFFFTASTGDRRDGFPRRFVEKRAFQAPAPFAHRYCFFFFFFVATSSRCSPSRRMNDSRSPRRVARFRDFATVGGGETTSNGTRQGFPRYKRAPRLRYVSSREGRADGKTSRRRRRKGESRSGGGGGGRLSRKEEKSVQKSLVPLTHDTQPRSQFFISKRYLTLSLSLPLFSNTTKGRTRYRWRKEPECRSNTACARARARAGTKLPEGCCEESNTEESHHLLGLNITML